MRDEGDSEAPTPKDFEEKVALAHGVLSALERALRTSRLYAPEHQVRQQADKEIQARFQGFFERFTFLRLEVTQTELKMKTRVLMKCEPRDPEAPFRLYKDGIRELRFHRGLDPEELAALLALLQMDRRELAETDQDLVSLLWAKDFKTIDHVTVDEFDSAEDGRDGGSDLGLGQGLRTDLASLLGALTRTDAPTGDPGPAPAPGAPAAGGSGGGSAPGPAAPGGTGGNETLPVTVPSGHFPGGVPATPPGMEEVERMLRTSVDPALGEIRLIVEEQTLGDAVHRAFTLLSANFTRSGSLAAAEVAPLLRGLVEAHARKGDLSRLGRLMKELRRQGLLDRVSGGTEVWTALVERSVAPEVRKLLSTSLNGPVAEDVEGFEDYLSLAGAALVPEVCAAYGRVKSSKVRGSLREYLKTHGRSAPIAFKGLLEAPENILAEVFEILRHLKPSSAAVDLDAAFERLPRLLKLEALGVAAGMEGLARARIFRRAFGDADPSIRSQAFRKASETPSHDLHRLVQEWIGREEFPAASFDDKLMAYRAYVRLAGDACLPHVKELASHKPSLFSGPRANELRHAAVLALGGLSTPAARAQLEEWAKGGDRSLKDFAEEAMKPKSGGETLRRKY